MKCNDKWLYKHHTHTHTDTSKWRNSMRNASEWVCQSVLISNNSNTFHYDQREKTNNKKIISVSMRVDCVFVCDYNRRNHQKKSVYARKKETNGTNTKIETCDRTARSCTLAYSHTISLLQQMINCSTVWAFFPSSLCIALCFSFSSRVE